MKEKNNIKTTDITYIAIGLAAIIIGGMIIYQVSSVVAIPGVKYILMAPYLSMIIYILMSKIQARNSAFLIGTAFGFIMVLINIFMGISIIVTAILTEISIIAIKKSNVRCFVGSILFSMYAGMSALIISKYMIGGVFAEISLKWIVITGAVCFLFGYAGAKLGKRIMTYINLYHYAK